ncbi:hypothetical protein [Pantoea agglomerans]|uniref:hypothetical protein n=1 Tax=Enterobacter agglomerans TaxID=549 RepID=UPI0032086C94
MKKLFEKLKAAIRQFQSPDKRWPNWKEHDYTNQGWGHALHGMTEFREEGKFNITGHDSNRGLYFVEQMKEGDKLRVKFTNGKHGYLRIHRLSFFRDPSDMFSATVKFEGLIP